MTISASLNALSLTSQCLATFALSGIGINQLGDQNDDGPVPVYCWLSGTITGIAAQILLYHDACESGDAELHDYYVALTLSAAAAALIGGIGAVQGRIFPGEASQSAGFRTTLLAWGFSVGALSSRAWTVGL